MQVSGQPHAIAALTPTEIITATHCTGDWVSPSDAVRSGNRRLGTEPLPA